MHKGAFSDASAVAEGREPVQAGFTLVQIAVGLAILGILGGLAVSKWSQFSRKQALMGEGKNLLAFMQEARSYGAKKSMQVGISCEVAGQSCWIFGDANVNGIMDAGEGVRQLKLSHGIGFGLASSGPNAGPQNIAAPSTGLGGAWAQAWVAATDLSASPSVGAFYLRHSLLPVFTLCLNGTASSQKIALSLWNGSTWITM